MIGFWSCAWLAFRVKAFGELLLSGLIGADASGIVRGDAASVSRSLRISSSSAAAMPMSMC